LPSQKDW